MDFFKAYAVNKTDAEVQLIEGTIKIPSKGWRGLTETEISHQDVIYAMRKDWITVQKTEPKSPETPEKAGLKTYTAESTEFRGEKEPRVKVTKIGG